MLSMHTNSAVAAAQSVLKVDSTVVAMACKLDASALVRLVLSATKKEFDDVAFWNSADETRIERNVGDSVTFVKEGISRVVVLAEKLQLLQKICQRAIAAKAEGEEQVRSAVRSLEALGIGDGEVKLAAAADDYARQRVLLEKAADVQLVLAAEAATAFDQLSARMFDLYGVGTSSGHSTIH
ncbi:MAG: hypothetical protein WC028_30765 [Candidatus Obscuribacterales bacterium]